MTGADVLLAAFALGVAKGRMPSMDSHLMGVGGGES